LIVDSQEKKEIHMLSTVTGDIWSAVRVVVSRPLRVLGYLYLLRVAVIITFVTLAFPILSWLGPLRSLTVGAYEVRNFWPALTATIVFTLVSGSGYAVALAFADGIGKRYDLRFFNIGKKALRWWRIAITLSIVANICWMLAASWQSVAGPSTPDQSGLESSIWHLLGGVAAGLVVSALFGGFKTGEFHSFVAINGGIVGKWVSPLIKFLHGGGLLHKFTRWFEKGAVCGWLANFYTSMGAGGGVLCRDAAGDLALEKGQAGLHIYAAFTTVVYAAVLVFSDSIAEAVAPVAAVFLLCVALVYLGSGLTYLLDFYRVPLIMFVVAYCGVCTQWRESDHFYPVYPKPHPPVLVGSSGELGPGLPPELETGEGLYIKPGGGDPLGLPAQLLGLVGKRIKEEKKAREMAAASAAGAGTAASTAASSSPLDKPVIILVFAGGGIQAAAWPLAALEKIEKQIPGFHNHVLAVSGVSGGSVGAMYYAHAYSFPKPTADPAIISIPLDASKKAAQESSLGKVTMAILRDDFIKAAFPFFIRETGGGALRDRGLALEDTFGLNASKYFPEEPKLVDASLVSWGRDAMALKRPALIMNATVVETGERISYSTVPRSAVDTPGTVEFTSRYRADLSVATAARLSATFPVVSPAARPAVIDHEWTRTEVVPGREHWEVFKEGNSFLHVVDGGYFETSGVVGALSWLGEAMEQLSRVGEYTRKGTSKSASEFFAMPPQIVFIQMSGFPVPPARTIKDEGRDTSGTLFDLISPVVAAVGIRNGVQASFPDELVKLFKKRWDESNAGVRFEHFVFQPVIRLEEWDKKPWLNSGFLPQSPPLSWHLRQTEKDRLQLQVNEGLTKEIEQLKRFIPETPTTKP